MNSETRWAAVDTYITDLLVRPEPALHEALAASAAADLPAISVSAPQGKFLQLLARANSAKRILEVGTLGAYSTIWLARALPDNGKLVTLEFEPKHAEVARQNLSRAGLNGKVELRVGRASESMAALIRESVAPFDLIFIDANKEGYPEYLALALKLARLGTLIIADNVIRKGEVIDAASADSRVQGVRKFNDLVAAEPRLSATAIQTVGNKGYDGFTIALVVA
jgi:predicted O-methyltransferase YrrM